MKAMLLAAGRGDRMLPLTRSTPKPALPVLGRPLVTQVLRRLAAQGVDAAVVNLHHLPDEMRRTIGSGDSLGLPPVQFSEEPELQGTAGGLRQAAPLLVGDGTIVVSNSDFMSDVDLDAALATHHRSGCPATLVLAPERRGYSVVETDAEGRVLTLAGHPAAPVSRVAGRYTFTGLHLIEESVLELIPAGRPSDVVRDVYRALAAAGRLASHVHRGFWQEFGTPSHYLAGSASLLDLPPERLRAVTDDHDPVRELGRARAAVGAGVELHPTASFEGHVALGLAAKVGEGAHLCDTVVMPEAWIGPQARLERVIVGRGVEVPAGTHLAGAMVSSDVDAEVELPPGTRRQNGLLLRELD